MSDDTPLSAGERRALASVLDEIIPPSADGRFPGAGALGLGDGFAARPDLRPLLTSGLAALDEAVRRRGVAELTEIASENRRALLEGLAAQAPAFLPTLVGETFVAYYQDRRVRSLLGLETRPPFPEGYTVPPTDFAILDPVRGRAPIYRKP